ncbi:ABC-2 type transport system ATP-binding protein [Streptomyces sp. BK208]|uniref:ABC transporter ATP-binding protein n=1 Tax=Streptomyces sp. BK208 TaxID=2512150 RepID=UPI00105E8F99|nr:ATP-binding cassette domain-containing protein [Streptomyces sp. BK208]TDT23058.1 ABC-2 type transport system ATP-binding protein [Streptomyces sp. BK208]
MKALEISSLSKRYGERIALDSLSFTVPPGEIFGFVGSNGAGKTTTMRIAVGVLEADTGEVRYGGEPAGLHGSTRFGYMPEERGLYPRMTVARHLVYLGRLHGLGAADAREAMLRWTERLHLAERRESTIDSLSLGNRQRVQLAIALVHDPDVLILDEPFSGLDPIAVQDMAQVIKEKAADGVPVLFSSHQLDLVERLCDRVGVIRQGRLAACGSPDELRSAGTARLDLHVAGAREDWPAHCPAVASYTSHEDGVLIELAPGHDENAVLEEAVRHGLVRRLVWHRPALAETFRHLLEPTEGTDR